MADYNGALNGTQIITTLDLLSAILDANYASMGIGASTESGTAALAALAMKTGMLGDGGANPGIGNVLAANLAAVLDAQIVRNRWDTYWAAGAGPTVQEMDAEILSKTPSGIVLTISGNKHALTNQLLRLNGAHTGVPTTPASAATLSATYVAGGGLPNFSSGNCPRMVFTLTGTNPWDESLLSPVATQIALSSSNNALSVAIAGTVPAGITYVNVYRGLVGGGAGVYGFDHRVAAVAGDPYPAITISQADALVNFNWLWPVWIGYLLKPQSAAQMALGYAVSGSAAITPGVPIPLTSANMVSPYLVALNPSNGFLGLGNVAQGAIFGTAVVGTGFTVGTIQTANDEAGRIQGFAGATKLQARVTSALNAAGTTTVTYTYFDAAHGYGSAQTDTAAAATFGGTTVGSLAVVTIPAGRLIQSVTGVTHGGGLTSGTYILEAQAVR